MKKYTNIDDIRQQMNEKGSNGEPFLFGINYEMSEGFFITNPLSKTDLLFQINGVGNKPSDNADNIGAELHSNPISYPDYQSKFDTVYQGLKRGDSFLANLTIKTPVETSISLLDIFNKSQSPYQLYMPNRFVCFSPERFVRISDGQIFSNPMKGTIDAAVENAEQIILNDFKETAEHNTIVDLIRNDLSMVADHVRVERFRYIDRIKSNDKEILQVSSEIAGELPANYQSHLGDILFRLLPAGSISGAPKAATIALIRSAEQEDRGYYTGIFGYYDGATLDSAVLIRFIEQDNDRMFFRSGGGITAYSRCEDEYQEILDKIYLPFKN